MKDKEYELMKRELIDKENNMPKSKTDLIALEKARKRVIAAIHNYCERCKIPHPTEYVIGIMQQSSGYNDINKIPYSKLTALYNFWRNNNDIIDRSKFTIINLN